MKPTDLISGLLILLTPAAFADPRTRMASPCHPLSAPILEESALPKLAFLNNPTLSSLVSGAWKYELNDDGVVSLKKISSTQEASLTEKFKKLGTYDKDPAFIDFCKKTLGKTEISAESCYSSVVNSVLNSKGDFDFEQEQFLFVSTDRKEAELKSSVRITHKASGKTTEYTYKEEDYRITLASIDDTESKIRSVTHSDGETTEDFWKVSIVSPTELKLTPED
jgi:hypothetical protein